MRSLVATIAAVAFLANASLANAADGPAKAVAGYCEWSAEPQLTALTDVVDDADCASRNAVQIDEHIVTNVLVLPAPKGPLAAGQPIGERVIADVRYVDDAEGRGESVLVMEAYRSYRTSAREKTNALAQSVGDAQVRWFSVGPSWMRNVNATATATAIDYAGGVVVDAPLVALLPMIGPAVFIPGITSYFEDVRAAPAGIQHGAGEVSEGVSAGRFDQAAEGVGEVCGGVGLLVSAAIPFAAGAKAVSAPRPPISPFAGRAVPRLQAPPVVVTEALIREAMRDAPLHSQQSAGVSLPRIQQYVDRIQAGEVPPAIKVDGRMIVDGNHRYIAGRIAGKEPEVQPWAGGRPGAAVEWNDLPVKDEVWER